MPVRGGAGPMPMAMSCPVVSCPAMPARVVVAAAAEILRRGHPGIDISCCCLLILPIRAHAVAGATMTSGGRAEQGQALIIGVGRLNFFAIVDAPRRGFRLSGSPDQRGCEDGGQNESQGFTP